MIKDIEKLIGVSAGKIYLWKMKGVTALTIVKIAKITKEIG